MTAATILVVEDNPITRKMIRVALATDGYAVLEAGDGTTALKLLAEHAPDLVLQDLLLPDMDGYELLERSRAMPQGSTVPILAISGFLSKLEQARSLQAGFTDYLFKPVEPSRLLSTVGAYLRRQKVAGAAPGRGQHVVLVDDDPLQLKLVKVNIEHAGLRVTTADNGTEAIEKARADLPAAIVSDVLMPGMDGFQLCVAVRQDPQLATVPVVLTSAVYNEHADQELAHAVGANAFVMRTPDCRELVEALLACLRQGPQAAPHQPVELPREQYTYRVIRQLEHQVSHSANLARRVSLLEAELGILARMVETLKSSAEADTVLADILFRCLDAAGISSGAAYLLDPGGQLRLHARLGYQGRVGQPLAESQSHGGLLQQVLEHGEPLEVSTAKTQAEENLLAEWGAKSVLITPLVVGDQRLGVLEMVSASRELGDDWISFAKTVGSQVGQSLELARTLSRLRASEQRYRDLVQGMDAIVWEADADSRKFTFVSQRAASLVGYPVEHWLNGPAFFASIVHPDDRQRMLAASLTAVAQGRDHVLEYRVFTADERIVWLHDTVRVLLDEGGEPLQLRGVMVDVTKRRQAAEQETKLQLAQQIHQRLFPTAPPRGIGYDIGGVSHPAEATGGDCFDYLPMADGGLAVAIGDVSGHGFGAALLMAETRAYLRALALTNSDVGEILGLLNRALTQDMATDHFVTMLLTRLDRRTGTFTYSGAGHPSGYVIDASGAVRATLESTGLPLGVVSDTEYPLGAEIHPNPGDIVLLLTDGIVEARSPDGEPFGSQRAIDLVRLYRRQAARDIAENLYRAVRAFAQNLPQDDDITTVVIRVEQQA